MTSEESTTEDYWECGRCDITSEHPDRMCPCPRGGCEAEVVGAKITTILIVIDDKEEVPEEMRCHGGTKKEELLDFVGRNEGKKIEIHYEANLYPDRWGDDDFFTYDTSTEKHLSEIIDTIKTHYIHGIKVVN